MPRQDVVTPVPGTFYRRPDPESDPFKQEGDAVEPGDTLGLVEIMKNFTAVESAGGGRLLEFLVADEEAVVAGQAVAVVDDGA